MGHFFQLNISTLASSPPPPLPSFQQAIDGLKVINASCFGYVNDGHYLVICYNEN